jgi:hypothetical protein
MMDLTVSNDKNYISLRDIKFSYKVCIYPNSFEKVINFNLLHIFLETALNPAVSRNPFVEADRVICRNS